LLCSAKLDARRLLVHERPVLDFKDCILVHPKDRQEKEDLTECVYKVPCANCSDKTYIGETGRKFEVRSGTQD